MLNQSMNPLMNSKTRQFTATFRVNPHPLHDHHM
jgi:hypothetical protein